MVKYGETFNARHTAINTSCGEKKSLKRLPLETKNTQKNKTGELILVCEAV